jgi:hypothetical protein
LILIDLVGCKHSFGFYTFMIIMLDGDVYLRVLWTESNFSTQFIETDGGFYFK